MWLVLLILNPFGLRLPPGQARLSHARLGGGGGMLADLLMASVDDSEPDSEVCVSQ